ncbi:hypothetical protein KC951_01045 [Candidatus Saccharibacteria bacterium]|nr:hypothetical protein [Candidatus Saccharibacteria bacterium]
MSPRTTNSTGWVGWVYFAGILMIISAIFQGLFGFVALLKNELFVVGPEKLVIVDYTAWGWIHLVLSVILLTAGFSVLSGGAYGRVVGVILASVGFIANMLFLPAYPVWSIIVMVLNIIVLYALVVHGKEAQA